jgi:hypothetical protein
MTTGDPLCWPRDTLYPQKLVLTSPTSSGIVGIVRSRIKATDSFHTFMAKLNYRPLNLRYKLFLFHGTSYVHFGKQYEIFGLDKRNTS